MIGTMYTRPIEKHSSILLVLHTEAMVIKNEITVIISRKNSERREDSW